MEELDASPFLARLRKSHRRLWASAARAQHLVLVPCAAALAGVALTRDTFERHVFAPSPFFQREYDALRKGKLTVVYDAAAGVVRTKDGFAHAGVEIPVLTVDTHYTDKDEPFLVLLVARALSPEMAPGGAVAAPDPQVRARPPLCVASAGA